MQILDQLVTTDDYQDSELASYNSTHGKIILRIFNSGANPLMFRAFANEDNDDDWEPITAEIILSAGASHYETSTEPWGYYKVQVKSFESGNSTTVDAVVREVGESG